jgi:hypothetical protein
VANAQIKALTAEVVFLTKEADSVIDASLRAAHAANEAGVNKVLTMATPALYSGTKEAEDLYNIQTKATASIAAAQGVYTATRTNAEQYALRGVPVKRALDPGRD